MLVSPTKDLASRFLLILNPSPLSTSKTSRWAFLTDQMEVLSSPLEALDLLEQGNYPSRVVDAFRSFVNQCKREPDEPANKKRKVTLNKDYSEKNLGQVYDISSGESSSDDFLLPGEQEKKVHRADKGQPRLSYKKGRKMVKKRVQIPENELSPPPPKQAEEKYKLWKLASKGKSTIPPSQNMALIWSKNRHVPRPILQKLEDQIHLEAKNIVESNRAHLILSPNLYSSIFAQFSNPEPSTLHPAKYPKYWNYIKVLVRNCTAKARKQGTNEELKLKKGRCADNASSLYSTSPPAPPPRAPAPTPPPPPPPAASASSAEGQAKQPADYLELLQKMEKMEKIQAELLEEVRTLKENAERHKSCKNY